MERQVPTGISNIFEQIAQKNEEERRKSQAEKEKWPLAKNLYQKAESILMEYGIEERIAKNVIRLETPPVKLAMGDLRFELMIRNGLPHALDRFREITIHKRREGDNYFNTNPLFTISLHEPIVGGDIIGMLGTQLERSAGQESIQAVSNLLDVMQQSLSETHTPRSQQIKPEEPKKGLRDFFKRLKAYVWEDVVACIYLYLGILR